ISVSLVCFSTCEVFQASAALQCYQCSGLTCDAKAVNCSAFQDTCYTSTFFQDSEALKCYECAGSTCNPTQMTCPPLADRCQTTTVEVEGQKGIVKGCVPKAACDAGVSTGLMKCCQTDLCNGAEGVTLSLLIMLVPLISSI
ncbi:hypothetical protein NFI96_027547, partial [Prochilodus magdalenae]